MTRAYSKTVTPRAKRTAQVDLPDPPKHIALIQKAERRNELVSLSDRVAKSNVWFGNWKFPGADLAFPQHPWLRTVDKYYPQADGGPVCFDEIGDNDIEMSKCVAKKKKINAAGIRYVIIDSKTDLESAFRQLHSQEVNQ